MARVLPHHIIFVNANQTVKAKPSPPLKRLCLPNGGRVPPRPQQKPPKREPKQQLVLQHRPQPATQPRRPDHEAVECRGKPTVESKGGVGVVLVMSLGMLLGGCTVRETKKFAQARFQNYFQSKVDKCMQKMVGKHQAEVRELQGTVRGLQEKIDAMQTRSSSLGEQL
ncbi:hypothetical protein PG987_005754 [Apiospora arundinis]